MTIQEVFERMVKENASDAIMRAGTSLKLRVSTELIGTSEPPFTEDNIQEILSSLISTAEREVLEKKRGYDIGINYTEQWRFRIGIFYQQDKITIVARRIDLSSLNFEKLNLPKDVLERLCHERRGLIILVGMTGSGKSTTIASMIEYINAHFGRHIITVEEPVEYIFKDKMSVIDQREIGRDVMDYAEALKQMATLSPDVLFVGDIKDTHICSAVLKAAEKGMLVFSTMHSLNAQMTVETLVNLFPPEQQDRIFMRLSLVLKGVIAQRLIPRLGGKGLIPAYEVMTLSPTIASAISEKRVMDIPKIIRESTEIYKMNTYNQCLLSLLKSKIISRENALDYSDNKRDIEVSLTFDGDR